MGYYNELDLIRTAEDAELDQRDGYSVPVPQPLIIRTIPAAVAIVALVVRNMQISAPQALADLRARMAGDATPLSGRTTRTLDAYQITTMMDGRNAALVAALALV